IYDLFSREEFGIDHFLVSRLGPGSEENPGRFRGEFVFNFEEQYVSETSYAESVGKIRELARSKARPTVLDLIDLLTYFPTLNRPQLLKMRGAPCPIPWIYSQVSTSGAMYLCCYTATMVGNWRSEGFEGAWNSPRMQEIRREMVEHGVSRHC